MTIQVRCPNSACGKLLAVRDDFAGKTGKCPSCGTTMPIPYPNEAPSAAITPEVGEPPAREELEAIPVRGGRARQRRYEEDEEDESYDDYDEDDDRRPRRRRTREEDERRRRPVWPEVSTLVCLGLGIFCFLVLSIIPLFSYATASGAVLGFSASKSSDSLFTGDPDFIGTWQGKVLMIATLAVLVLTAVALILYLTFRPEDSDPIITITGAVAGAWGVTVLLWLLGLIWKVFNLSGEINKRLANNPLGKAEISITPGVAIWIGLIVAVGGLAAFSTLMSLRRKTLWMYVGEGVGLALGILITVLVVQPWKTTYDKEGGGSRPKFLTQAATWEAIGGKTALANRFPPGHAGPRSR